ncbi:MAG: S8 family serine peptidase [Actinoplanes sp.]
MSLLTGDRVLLTADGMGIRDIVAAPGRQNIRFLRQRIGSDNFVVPADVVKLIAAGRVSQELFDVTKLAEQPPDAVGHSGVRLIAHYADGAVLPAGSHGTGVAEKASSAETERIISSPARMTAVSADAAGAPGLWARIAADLSAGRITKVWLDGVQHTRDLRSNDQIGAPAAWRAGFTGAGVKVAVLDGGYDGAHPDLRNAVVATKSFVGDEPAGQDTADGHGTHVASIIAGSGAASDGKYKGVAPGAKLLIGKVCSDNWTDEGSCPESAILAGMQWAAEQGARVVNLSLGDYGTEEYTPLEQMIDTLTAQTGTLFVAAAGNASDASVASPGSADAAISVGSVDTSNRLSDFSTQGPRLRDGAVKPDLVAPGEGITAARAGSDPTPYVKLSGTSMSTPHVAGAAALVAQAHPEWRASQIKGALMGSAVPVGTAFESGAGRLDLARAVAQPLLADPASVSFGRLPWPQRAGEKQTETVELHNTTASPVSLSLRVLDAEPDDVFSAPSTVDVPANGVAEVVLTATAPASGATGNVTASLLASNADGTVQARIPMGTVLEPENYQHTVTLLDRSGKPSSGLVTFSPVPEASGREFAVAVAGPGTKVRLPRGHWTMLTSFQADADDPSSPVILGALPDVDSKDHQTIAFDGRRGKPVTMTVPDRDVRVVRSSVSVEVSDGHRFVSRLFDGPTGPDVTRGGAGGYVIPTPHRRTGAREFRFVSRALFAKPAADGFGAPAEVYQVARVVPGAVPEDLDYRPTTAAFATVTTTVARVGRDGELGDGWKRALPVPDEDDSSGVLPTPDSGVRTTRLASSGPVQWQGSTTWNEAMQQIAEPRTFSAGHRYTVAWYQPMLTLALPGWAWSQRPLLRRAGDHLSIDRIPMWSGNTAGHHGTIATKDDKVTLYENGTQIGEEYVERSGVSFDVSPEKAEYRMVIDSTPQQPDVAGARSRVEWTFTSTPLPTTDEYALPVSIAHLAPELDADGRAPTGPFVMPIQVQGDAGKVTALAVDASYDEGQTWAPATVTGHGDQWSATLQHPATTHPVSLRTRLTRADGGTTSYTQINAYRLR